MRVFTQSFPIEFHRASTSCPSAVRVAISDVRVLLWDSSSSSCNAEEGGYHKETSRGHRLPGKKGPYLHLTHYATNLVTSQMIHRCCTTVLLYYGVLSVPTPSGCTKLAECLLIE